MPTLEHSRRIDAFRSEWASGLWQSQVKPDMRAEWERHLNALGLSLDNFRGLNVLEIGCGATGVIYYLPPGGRRTGVDPSAPAVARWNRTDGAGRLPVELIDGEAETLPFAASSFDAAFCINCLDHTSNPAAIVSEVHRVLRPGGMLVLHYDIDSPLRKLHKLLRPHVALLHPHSLTYQWTSDHILNNPRWLTLRTHHDSFEYAGRLLLSESFWDNLIFRASGLKSFINHLWIASVSASDGNEV